jgi:hypothetical protein
MFTAVIVAGFAGMGHAAHADSPVDFSGANGSDGLWSAPSGTTPAIPPPTAAAAPAPASAVEQPAPAAPGAQPAPAVVRLPSAGMGTASRNGLASLAVIAALAGLLCLAVSRIVPAKRAPA